jgi:diguanylate cyclase (GGDEF)-like protein
VRSYDYVARYGGEEFLIVAPNCDPASALDLAQRLRSSLDQKPIDLPEGVLPLTCSLGVAVGGLASKDNSDSMLRAADVLADHVQAAKGLGKVEEGRSAAMAEELAALPVGQRPAGPAVRVADHDLDDTRWGP